MTLPPELQSFVVQQVATGVYRDENELVTDAVRRLRDDRLRQQQLKNQIQESIASLDRGEGIVLEGDEALERFFDEIEAEVEQEIADEQRSGQ